MMIDIITINLNNKEGLKRTIESVINQTYFDKVNFIIIDGGSTDGSVDIIKEYRDKLYYWISEKDDGIYNAMNKGIKVSLNDYCLFLNSGDYLKENNALERVFPYLNGDYDLVYGNEWKLKDRYKNNSPYEAKYPDKLDESFFRRTSLPHQSTFIKTELLKKHKYDEGYKVISDWKFFRESWKSGCTYIHVPFIISAYYCNGFSYQNLKLMKEEKNNYYRNF